MPTRRLLREEIGERGVQIYESRWRALLEPQFRGQFVAIDVETEDYEVANEAAILSYPGSCLGTYCLGGSASLPGTVQLRERRLDGSEAESRRPCIPRREPGKEEGLLPVGTDVKHAWLAGVGSGARIAPMDGIIDVSATQWIVVDVLELLPHDRFRFDDLRMAAFLP